MTVGAPDTKTAELQPESQTGGLVNSPSIAQVAPIFVLDSHEAWRPVPVEDSLERLGYVWEHGEGFVNKAGQKVDRLDFPQNLDPQRFSDLPLVGYHRTVEGAPLKWHQFWFWYIYNPKMYAGYGEHEGDWEMCQIGCDLTVFEHPILMTLSQHSGGEKREFWRVEADPPKTSPHRSVIYIARDSHAAYRRAPMAEETAAQRRKREEQEQQQQQEQQQAEAEQQQQQEEELSPEQKYEQAAQDKIEAEAEERNVPEPVKSQEAQGDIQKPPTTAEQRLKGVEVQEQLSELQGQTWPASPDLTKPIPSNSPANPPQPDQEVEEEEQE
jgi:hypothetical protein